MDEVIIIEASDAHAEGIADIFNHAVRETYAIWSETETTAEQRRHWMQTRRAAGYPVLVAVAKPAPAVVLGYGSFGVFRDFPGFSRTVEHSVYVAPSAQRRGIGRALLAELVERARGMGMEAMVGGVDSANAASLSLHQQAGFEREGTLRGVGRKFGRRLDLAFVVLRLSAPDPEPAAGQAGASPG